MTVPFIDPDWQEAATANAKKGYPWAVWGRRKDRDHSLGLHASVKTEDEANRIAENQRASLRPKGTWIIIVSFEGEGEPCRDEPS